MFHGLPDILFTDNDKALRSHAMQRMFHSLQIQTPKLKEYHPQGKGSVESHINIWQRWFESVFHLPQFQPKDIDQVNEWAFKYALYYQMTKEHTRHKETRFAKWNNCIGEHLREICSFDTYKTLLYSDPEERTVTGSEFSWYGTDYRVKGLPNGAKIDVVVHPFEFEKNGALTIQYPARSANQDNVLRTQIQTLTVLPVVKNPDGYNIQSLSVNDPQKAGKSKTQKAFEKLEKVELPKEAKGGNPFTLPVPEKVPTILPKVGKTIQVAAEMEIKEVEYNFYQAKKQLVQKLGRSLDNHDIQIINAYGGDKQTYTEKDIEDMYDLIKAGQPEAAEGGNK